MDCRAAANEGPNVDLDPEVERWGEEGELHAQKLNRNPYLTARGLSVSAGCGPLKVPRAIADSVDGGRRYSPTHGSRPTVRLATEHRPPAKCFTMPEGA